MIPISVLYLGPEAGTSGHRVGALRRLGCRVTVVDPRSFLPSSRVVDKWVWEMGGGIFASYVGGQIQKAIGATHFDLALVDAGELLSPAVVRGIRKQADSIVNYNIDDPFGDRDKNKWKMYLAAVPEYDLIAVVRDSNIEEAAKRGAKKVLKVYRSADEIAHAPRRLTAHDRQQWSSDVLFVGTWMPERGPFAARLLELGVPLAIYGNLWERAPEWPILRSAYRGASLDTGDSYAKAIQCAKVVLGFVSKGNRDLSTTRTFEITYLGGVFCAERTSEHMQLYREDEEAAFWSTPDECAAKCLELMQDPDRRERLARAARARCIANGTTNEKILEQILSAALAPQQVTA